MTKAQHDHENELEVNKKGLHASGAISWVIAVGVSVAIACYGYSTIVGGPSMARAEQESNKQEHKEFRTEISKSKDAINGIDQKLDLVIQLLREKQGDEK